MNIHLIFTFWHCITIKNLAFYYLLNDVNIVSAAALRTNALGNDQINLFEICSR